MAETTTTEKKPTVQETFQTRETDSQANIGKVYNAGLDTQKKALLDAYNANTAAQDAQSRAVQQNYALAGHDVGVQNNRNAANLTQFANVRGVNTQAGSQHQLSLGNARANALGDLAFQQQQALQEADRQKQLMTTTYQNQVQAAIADNDYKKAAALLDDYNNQRKWRDEQAQILASYGNFDPYKDLYGEDAAKGMRTVWLRQNPDTAYKLGEMDPYTYHDITGRWPDGFRPGGGGGLSFPGLYNDDGTPKAGAEKWLNPGGGGGGGGGGKGSGTPYTLITSTFPWR